MTHRYTVEAVEQSLRDPCNQNQIFGVKMVILGGEFRQVLPVVIRGSRADIVLQYKGQPFGFTAIFNILEPTCTLCIQI